MVSGLCAVPRGLSARIVWLGLALVKHIKRQAARPPSAGGTMRTKQPAPARGGSELPMVAHGLTHTGKRSRNEDRYLIREDLGLVVVADGFGGAAGGDIAARIAVDEIGASFGAQGHEQTVPNLDPEELTDGLTVGMVRFAIEHAHARIGYEARRTGPPGMSTAVALLVVAGPRVVIGYAGSVRAYRFRNDTLEQLTTLDPLTTASACPVGTTLETAPPRIRTDRWQPGDLYLLCTAGLHRVLGAEPIRCTLAMRSSMMESAAALVGRALHAGAADNVTAVMAMPVGRAGGPA